MNKTIDAIPAVSFEFFPPHSEQMQETLWKSIKRLQPLAPSFVSVTYGADGSTRERTHDVVERIVNETDLTVAPHLTCVGASREEIDEIARQYPQNDLNFNGQLDDLQESLDSMVLQFLFGVLLICVILGTRFRSYFQPYIII